MHCFENVPSSKNIIQYNVLHPDSNLIGVSSSFNLDRGVFISARLILSICFYWLALCQVAKVKETLRRDQGQI